MLGPRLKRRFLDGNNIAISDEIDINLNGSLSNDPAIQRKRRAIYTFDQFPRREGFLFVFHCFISLLKVIILLSVIFFSLYKNVISSSTILTLNTKQRPGLLEFRRYTSKTNHKGYPGFGD